MTETSRRVVANISLTLDGRYAGPGGPQDLGWVMPYAVTDVSRDHMASLCESATTALLGRTNAEGFMGFWPSVVDDESADPRDRAYAKWLVEAEKVVLSTTLTEPPWERTRVVDAPAAQVVDELVAEPGGDILVNNSASVIKALLAADKLDRLALTVFPELLGGGPRLLDDGLPPSRWTLADQTAGEHGALSLVYDRIR
jgi:dihydrofolate reductase